MRLDADLADAPMTDERLTALALAAAPDPPLDDHAVPLTALLTEDGAPSVLPDWYMPAPAGGRRLRGWRRGVALLVVAASLAVAAAGLCNSYGVLGPA